MEEMTNNSKRKIAAITFGCKINQYETACILDDFIKIGYQVVDFDEIADVYLINSCTVTNRTDYKSRNVIRKALSQKENNPDVKVVVTGCYAQRNYDEIMKIGDIDLVIDNNKKDQVVELLESNLSCFESIMDAEEFAELSTTSMIDKTRAFVKVQDGCDFYCAYCAIPYARGHSRSRKKDKVLDQIKVLVDNGYKEFVLGGINLGLYGRENKDGYYLSHLLQDIENIEGVELIRLSSLEPQLFSEDILEYFRNSSKISPHFHIPLQVGCDELLKIMNRHYTTAEYVKLVDELHSIFPEVAIGMDVIVGLPCETDKLFHKTYELLKSLDFSYLHVFSYSKRPGTKAEKMSGHVHGKDIKKRSNMLTELSDLKKEQYINRLLNKDVPLSGVLEKKVGDYWTALSDHYIRIYLKSEENLSGKYKRFKPVAFKDDGLEVVLSD